MVLPARCHYSRLDARTNVVSPICRRLVKITSHGGLEVVSTIGQPSEGNGPCREEVVDRYLPPRVVICRAVRQVPITRSVGLAGGKGRGLVFSTHLIAGKVTAVTTVRIKMGWGLLVFSCLLAPVAARQSDETTFRGRHLLGRRLVV